jgi:TolB protein
MFGVKGVIVVAVLLMALAVPSSVASTGVSAGKGRIAYSDRLWPANQGDNWEILVVRASGGRSRNLTRNPNSDDITPAWSRSGRMLAFSRSPTASTRPGMFVLGADTGQSRRIITGRAESPAWSPDDKRIAFSRGGSIWIVNARGGGLRRIVRGAGPTWSPDGRRIALYRGGIFVVNLDGSELQRLTVGDEDAEPAWSPNGREIAYSRADGIYVMNADGSNGRKLVGVGTSPAWSPDSRQLAFSIDNPSTSGIWVMNADGCHRRRVASAGQPAGVSWGR